MFLSEFTGFHGTSLALLTAAVAPLGAWGALLAWRWFATFPYLPDAGPATDQLGEEPAAIVSLLAHRWHVKRSAVAATLLDLAARELLAVEQYGDRVVIRVYDERHSNVALTPYEELVLKHIADRARARSAPAAALEFDSEGQANSFWRRFSRAVETDARDRGLAWSRWTREDQAVLGTILAVALGLLALAFSASHLGDGNGEDAVGPLEWGVGALIAWVVVNGFVFSRRTIRDTAAGRSACSRWLGVRDYLRAAGTFADLPAAAVTTWGRYLACRVGLGVCHGAAAELPFGAEEPDTAWSRATGEWRELEVNYPERLGATRSPAGVLLSGLAQALLFGFLLFIAFPIVGQGAWELGKEVNDVAAADSDVSRFAWFLAIMAAALALGAAVLLGRFLLGLLLIYRGIADLSAAKVIEGEVVKVYGGRVAIDPGDGRDEVVAWVPSPGLPSVTRGMRLRVTKTPRLHFVSRVEAIGG